MKTKALFLAIIIGLQFGCGPTNKNNLEFFSSFPDLRVPITFEGLDYPSGPKISESRIAEETSIEDMHAVGKFESGKTTFLIVKGVVVIPIREEEPEIGWSQDQLWLISYQANEIVDLLNLKTVSLHDQQSNNVKITSEKVVLTEVFYEGSEMIRLGESKVYQISNGTFIKVE